MRLEDKLFLNRYRVDSESHLAIKDPDTCRGRCPDRPCIYVCPVGVYEWLEKEGRLAVGYEACVECGACRIICPFDNIAWRYPRGGYGVSYKYG